MCKPTHSSHAPKFFTPSKQVIDDLTTGLRRCFDKIEEFDKRAKELVGLMAGVKGRLKGEYEEMEGNLVEQVKGDRKRLEGLLGRLGEVYGRIEQN